jgi:hypothetical protein
MEFKKSLLSAVAGAALVAFAGGAYAADEDKSPGAMGPGATSPRETVPPAGGAVMPSTPSDRLGAERAGQAAHPPGFIMGKSVLNTEGEKIGTVSKIDGDNVIVSVGGFLGIGSHDVALPWSQLRLSGTGDDARLQTALTKEELKAMPEYKEPAAGSTRSSPSGVGSGNGATGGSRTTR